MKSNTYESKRYLDEYLLFHYGKPSQLCPWPGVAREALDFHARLVREVLLPLSKRKISSALDIGCGTGRLTFELTRVADKVLGIDNSRSFIRAAAQMARKRKMTIAVKVSGDETESHEVALPPGANPAAANFAVADAHALASLANPKFDIVAAINLLCRLARPAIFLKQLAGIVVPGGQLLLASPYSWLGEFTPKRSWLSPKDVERFLSADFKKARSADIPFLIREHRRKYQLVVAQVSLFIRK